MQDWPRQRLRRGARGLRRTHETRRPRHRRGDNLPRAKRLRVVYLYFGPIPTKEALSNPALRAKINELGGKFVDELASGIPRRRGS